MIEAEHVPWTAYNINLGHEIQTAPQFACAHPVLRRVVQTIADLSKKPRKELRILDLASLEGIFALEFARHGSQVVAIEGQLSALATSGRDHPTQSRVHRLQLRALARVW